MKIRQEEKKDYPHVFELIEEAFKDEEHSDHQEQFLVERLRNSDAFVPELSMVAEIENKIVGYILFTKIKIKDGQQIYPSLALAPIAVLPSFQNRGIGAELIKTAHQKAKELGYGSVVLLGHENYYPRFGYKLLKNYGIRLPFEAPDENCMILELKENALKNIKGSIEYPKEFNL